MARLITLILLVFCFNPRLCFSAQLIDFTGKEFIVTTQNLLNMTPTTEANIWENQQTFSKLRILEISSAPQKYRSIIQRQVNNSPSAMLLSDYTGFTEQHNVLVVKELISQTPFIRFIFIDGSGSQSFHFELSMPVSTDRRTIKLFQEMLERLDWQVNSQITLKAATSVSVSRIPGFVVSQRFNNAVTLRSAKFLAPLNDAMVSISLADVRSDQDLRDATLQIIRSAKTLNDIKISAVEQSDTPTGQTVIVTGLANKAPDDIEIDLITITQKAGNSVVVVQIATVSHMESLLKMKDVASQILQHIRVIK